MPEERMAPICDGVSSIPEKMKRAPMTTPTMVPGGLKACAKLRRRSEVAGEPNCAMKGLQAVSRIEAPAANHEERNEKGYIEPGNGRGPEQNHAQPEGAEANDHACLVSPSGA